jgi:hypothetical protein
MFLQNVPNGLLPSYRSQLQPPGRNFVFPEPSGHGGHRRKCRTDFERDDGENQLFAIVGLNGASYMCVVESNGPHFFDRCVTTVEKAQEAYDSVAQLRREPAELEPTPESE